MTVVAQPRTDIWVCSTAAGVAAAWPRATRMDGFPVELGPGDRPLAPLATDTEADLNAFAADGTVYRVRAAELPVSARQSKGVRAVGVGRGGQVAALAPLEPEGGFLLLVTAPMRCCTRPAARRCASSWTGCAPSRARARAASPACGSTAATRSWR